MAHSEQLDKLAEALAIAQGSMKAAELNSINPFFKSRYADLGAVIEAARKPLSDNGLSITQLVHNEGATISLTTMMMHSSGQWLESSISVEVGDEKGRSFVQSIGAVVTYLRRTGYASMAGVYADEDSDGSGNGESSGTPAAHERPTGIAGTRQSWAASSALITRIYNEIPYYGKARPHIIFSLQKLGEAGVIKLEMTDDEVFTIINKHASEEAAKKTT